MNNALLSGPSFLASVPQVGGPTGPCEDKDVNCDAWAAAGECEKNPGGGSGANMESAAGWPGRTCPTRLGSARRTQCGGDDETEIARHERLVHFKPATARQTARC